MTWRFVASSVAGTSHLRDDRPGQDAHHCSVVEGDAGPVLIAVVSDGAGSSSHGGDGSAFVCADLASRLRTLPVLSDADGAAWLRDSIDETRAALHTRADAAELPARQFAATLLCAVLAEKWSAFAQVGDGAIVTSDRDPQVVLR